MFGFLKRLQFSEEDKILDHFIRKYFAYKPKSLKYFKKAITHKSLCHNSEIKSNERLEFLGDAILDAVVAHMLYRMFPERKEGYLSKIKSKIVNRKTLSSIAEEMGLRSVLKYQKGRTINLNSLEGNAFEAIIGAIYLDGGYDIVKSCIEDKIFKNYVDLNKVLEEEIDFKSKLFIWTQKNKLKIEFESISEINNGQNWEYVMDVLLNGKRFGRGFGSSKKEAEQSACQETLQLMGEI